MHPLTIRCCSHLRSGSIPISIIAGRQWTKPNPFRNPSHTLPLWLVRRNHDAPSAAKAIVIGAGPAGIAVVGNLFEALPRGKIVWIDRAFEGGSVGQFHRELPSYSPAGDYLEYARAIQTFRDISAEAQQPNAVTKLRQLEREMTCSLNYAADMLMLMTDGLLKSPRIEPVMGTVARVVRNPRIREWTVTLDTPEIGFDPNPVTFTAPIVVYCTGTHPKVTALPLPIDRLTVETALAPSRLKLLLPRDEHRRVAVFGSGHTAVLVLRNLFRLAAISHRKLRIRWFTRSENLVYAEPDPYYDLDEDLASAVKGEGVEWGADMRVKNESGGLAGEAAWFARTQLEGERLKGSDAGQFIERIVLPQVEEGLSEQEREAKEHEFMLQGGHLERVDHVVQCIGWERARLPELRPGLGPWRGPIGKPKKLIFNALTGSFFPSGGKRNEVVGLYGAGSAFPELVPTTKGWREPAVGIWKFMKFVNKMVPRWVQATKKGYFAKEDDGKDAEGRRRFHQYY
ncbi:hypothetical protein N657DRAFT_641104 [Parathielavia appendiculata]|uniref:FAD/NAD(P)-binding domain-containing protein n=1 Tax=Parathielavia appendiculata TaxID=2587402 RepID=A0AAN6U633_9PEZI|nr:hypothetical protein N657DRAFT_641104 [Parathielavia appendiculata]